LISQGHNVTLRPHPITVRNSVKKINKIIDKYKNLELFTYAPNTDNNEIFYESDVLISDWSGAAYEFALALEKPVLFVDTPRKIINTEYDKIGLDAFEDYSRWLVGEFFNPMKKYTLDNINKVSKKFVNKQIFSLNSSSKVACKYISELIQN